MSDWTETHRQKLMDLADYLEGSIHEIRLLDCAEPLRAALAEIARLTVENAEVTRQAAAEVRAVWEQRDAALAEIDRLHSDPYPSGFCRDCGRWYPPKKAEASQ